MSETTKEKELKESFRRSMKNQDLVVTGKFDKKNQFSKKLLKSGMKSKMNNSTKNE